MALADRIAQALRLTDKVSFIGPLVARVAVGAVFVGTGWGKLHHLADVTQFFTELGIPAPGLNAHVVASIEFVGGLMLVAGLLTRLAALPLMGTMVVAILTAKRGDIDGVTTLFGFNEFLYFAILLWLAVAGAGKASLDHLLKRRMKAPLPKPLLRPAPSVTQET